MSEPASKKSAPGTKMIVLAVCGSLGLDVLGSVALYTARKYHDMADQAEYDREFKFSQPPKPDSARPTSAAHIEECFSKIRNHVSYSTEISTETSSLRCSIMRDEQGYFRGITMTPQISDPTYPLTTYSLMRQPDKGGRLVADVQPKTIASLTTDMSLIEANAVDTIMIREALSIPDYQPPGPGFIRR